MNLPFYLFHPLNLDIKASIGLENPLSKWLSPVNQIDMKQDLRLLNAKK